MCRARLIAGLGRIDTTEATLARFGMPPPPAAAQGHSQTKRNSFKAAANAVIATGRMARLANEWKKQSAIKDALKDAYRTTRGKPFAPAPAIAVSG